MAKDSFRRVGAKIKLEVEWARRGRGMSIVLQSSRGRSKVLHGFVSRMRQTIERSLEVDPDAKFFEPRIESPVGNAVVAIERGSMMPTVVNLGKNQLLAL